MHHEASHLLAIPALRAAIEAALDGKVFYQDAFEAACRPAWDSAYPALERRLPDLHVNLHENRADGLACLDALRVTLKAGRRGTWALVYRHHADGRKSCEAWIFDGAAGVHERGDGWCDTPTFDGITDRMVGMEIFVARKAVERERATAAAAARLAELRLSPGTRLRDVEINQTIYSTGIVEEVYPATGTVRLHLTKRGSRHRYRATICANGLRFRAPEAAPELFATVARPA
ncbi:hypothetical protein [Rhodanobacter sp. FW106-PBR-LB-2-11]|uniref:hypothetical protein n=1 Tax=Rhodanobacter sp. FW106-PBR-LB-2-11 TaxID=1524463 RepID=UPI0034E3D164